MSTVTLKAFLSTADNMSAIFDADQVVAMLASQKIEVLLTDGKTKVTATQQTIPMLLAANTSAKKTWERLWFGEADFVEVDLDPAAAKAIKDAEAAVKSAKTRLANAEKSLTSALGTAHYLTRLYTAFVNPDTGKLVIERGTKKTPRVNRPGAFDWDEVKDGKWYACRPSSQHTLAVKFADGTWTVAYPDRMTYCLVARAVPSAGVKAVWSEAGNAVSINVKGMMSLDVLADVKIDEDSWQLLEPHTTTDDDDSYSG